MRKAVFIQIIFIPFLGLAQKPILSVSKNPVIVGETFEISVKVESKETVSHSIKWDSLPFRIKNENGSFDLAIDKFEVTSLGQGNKDKNEWSINLKAVIWDSGTFVFPSLRLKIGSNTLTSDSLLIESQLEKKIEGVDLYEIRESFINVKDAEKKANEEKVKSRKWLFILIALCVLVVFIIIFFFVRKVKNRKKEQLLSRELTLAERAFLAIDELEKLQLWKQDRHKDHFVELSFILRSYYSSLYSLNLLEKTTSETHILLQQLGLSTIHLKQIEFVLKHADLVKFAGSVLEESYVLALDEKARECVRLTAKN